MGVYDGSINNERMGDFEGGQVRIQGVTDKYGAGSEDFKKLLLNIGKCRGNRSEHFLGDSRIPTTR